MFRRLWSKDKGNVTIYPARRGSLWVVVLLVMIGVVFPARVWLAALVGYVLLFATAYYWAWALAQRVTWRRELRRGVLVVGDTLVERFEVANEAWVPLLWAEIADHSDVPGYSAARVEAVDGGGHKQWETEGTCQTRGVFHLGPWEVTSGDPLGLIAVRWEFPAEQTVLIYPRVLRLPPLTLPRGRAMGQARELRPTLMEEASAGGVRPYQPGDPLRRIHWRMTAHRGDLMSRLFDVEPSGDVWLVLDLDPAVQAGQGARSTEEYAVILAASLAAKLLHEGRAVGLACSGQHPVVTPPRPGTGHLWGILGHLARVRQGGTVTLSQLLAQTGDLFGRGRTLVIFTPSIAIDWVGRLEALRRRGLAAAVMWLDASTFVQKSVEEAQEESTEARGETREGVAEGEALQAVLARLGVPVHVITADFPFEVALKLRRRRKELRVLPGTGRVIEVEVEEEV